MEHKEFSIGLEFQMSGKRYRCTDIGSRVVIAIRLDKEDPSWYNGPPYAVVEIVIDEYDMEACNLIPLERS